MRSLWKLPYGKFLYDTETEAVRLLHLQVSKIHEYQQVNK